MSAGTTNSTPPLAGALGQEWLQARRDASIKHFGDIGLPRRNQEAWRFTNIRPLTGTAFMPSTAKPGSVALAALAPLRLPGVSHRMVFVDGRFDDALSEIGVLPEGVRLLSAAAAEAALLEAAFDDSELVGAQPLASLNAALFADGFVLILQDGAVLTAPVEIIYVSSGAATDGPEVAHIRNLVVAGAGSAAVIVETSAAGGAAWTNVVTSLRVADGASVHHAKLQLDGAQAVHTALARATLGSQARYENLNLILGARMSRQDVQARLTGPSAALGINGAYLLRGDQEATLAPWVDHAAPGCSTNEVVKGVMQDHAHGVFLGTIQVRPGADQTDARQLNRNLLMSDTAWVDTKPELEILADDVKCSHGATIGSLDEQALFYLQARGIDPVTAKHMLVEAFAADVLELGGFDAGIREHLYTHVRSWLGAPGDLA